MFKPWLQSQLAKLLSSDLTPAVKQSYWQLKRRLSPRLNAVEVFLKVDDPYSYLLAQVLPELQQRFRVKWHIYVIDELKSDMFPEPMQWRDNALQDGKRLAELYQLTPPEVVSLSPESILNTREQLLCKQREINEQQDLEQVKNAFEQLWSGTAPTLNSGELSSQILQDNQQRLWRHGHYLPASMYYCGTWFWGLDRLDHLEQLLNKQKQNTATAQVRFNKTYKDFCRRYQTEQVNTERLSHPLTLYYSIRSPYSHLALIRAKQLAAHYRIKLQLKPVIPMVMRGLSVPKTKKFYIFFDALREAQKLNIDYGYVADPLGDGVRRCYALFDWAQSQGKELEYIMSYSTAVNSQGILSQTDRGLEKIVTAAGLDWSDAQSILQTENWRQNWPEWAQANGEKIQQFGFWGVPVLEYGNCRVWGQDRIEFVEQAIRDSLLQDQ